MRFLAGGDMHYEKVRLLVGTADQLRVSAKDYTFTREYNKFNYGGEYYGPAWGLANSGKECGNSRDAKVDLTGTHNSGKIKEKT